MKKRLILLLSIALSVSACQTAQTISASSDEEATAVISEKQETTQADDTATSIPPTQADIPATETPVPPSSTSTTAPTATPSPLPTNTPTVEVLPTITTLPARYEGKTALLKIENKSGKPVDVYLSGVTYYELHFTKDQKIETAPWGDYYYRVYIDGVGPIVGNFLITNIDKHTLVIEKDKVHFVGP